MLPAPDTIHACPHCGHNAYRSSFLSGNTFSSRLWSDGYLQAPMLDDAVQVTRCTNCKATYWVQDAPVLERVPYGFFNKYSRTQQESRNFALSEQQALQDDPAPSRPVPPKMEHLDQRGHLEALKELALAPHKDREAYLRLRIWWAHNQPFRNALKPATPTEDAESLANLHGLLALLETSTEKGILLSAGALAALGRYGDARAILAELYAEGFSEEKKRFMQALKAEEGWLVALR